MKPNDTESYIQQSPEYAQPILEKIREWVQLACPEAKEQLKWSFPHFTYKGSSLCYMAAFKHHCAFGFWLAEYMQDPTGIFNLNPKENAMGNFGKIKSLDDLPPQQHIIHYVYEAMELIEMGVKIQKPNPPKDSSPLVLHDEFKSALDMHDTAKSQFEQMTASCQKEYAQWIAEAKRPETRKKRIENAIAWISLGKRRDWKYEK